jgi:hypothetical protein
MTAEEKREKYLLSARRWKRKNHERVRVHDRRWKSKNRKKLVASACDRQRINRAWLNEIKRRRGCIDCGTREGELHFDHVNPATKRFTVASRAIYARGTLLREIKKCQVRCVRCHRARSTRLGHDNRWRSKSAA